MYKVNSLDEAAEALSSYPSLGPLSPEEKEIEDFLIPNHKELSESQYLIANYKLLELNEGSRDQMALRDTIAEVERHSRYMEGMVKNP